MTAPPLKYGLEGLWPWLEPSPQLETAALARVLEAHRSLPSTNDRALSLARAGAAHGTAVVALTQTQGRGQRGKQWNSPEGAGLYVSFVLRPDLPPAQAPILPIVIGLSFAEAVQTYAPLRLGIKWPNDLLVAQGPLKGRKLGGVLVESSVQAGRLEYVIAGLGLNLREVRRPPELSSIATSLEALQVPARPDPETVLCAIAARMEMRLHQIESPRGLQQVTERWREIAFARGHRVQVQQEDQTITGILEGVDISGGLVLKVQGKRALVQRGQLLIPGVGT